ncbi:MAG: hypothetical protein U0900_04870 [Myxococcota bacterium]
MKTRLFSIVFSVVVSSGGLMAAGSATADAARGRLETGAVRATGTSSRASLDRRLAVALAKMDENLLALLGPATLDCAGEFVESGLETCVVRLDHAPGAVGSAGAASD